MLVLYKDEVREGGVDGDVVVWVSDLQGSEDNESRSYLVQYKDAVVGSIRVNGDSYTLISVEDGVFVLNEIELNQALEVDDGDSAWV